MFDISEDTYIDCALLGPNEVKFSTSLRLASLGGIARSPALRGLDVEYVLLNGLPFNAPRLICQESDGKFGAPEFESLSIKKIISPACLALASELHSQGLTYTIYNNFQSEKDRLGNSLRAGRISVLAITTTLYTSVFPLREIVKFVRDCNPDVPIVIGGPLIFGEAHARSVNDLRQPFLALDADFYVVSRSGERELAAIVRHLVAKDETPLSCATIVTRQNDYDCSNILLELSPETKQPANINWELFGDSVGKFAFVQTAFSCPFSCKFCEFVVRGGRYRQVAMEEVERELDRIAAIRTIEHVVFIDDTFNVPVSRFKQILRLLIKKRYGFRWSAFFRCDFTDDEVFTLLCDSNCEFLKLGIESGSQTILDNMKKGATIEKYENGLAKLNETGIPYWTTFIIGYPGETTQTVQETIDFIERTSPCFYRLSPWYCSPMTPAAREIEKFGLQGDRYNWRHNTMDVHSALDHCERVFSTVKNSIHLPFLVPEDLLVLIQEGVAIGEIKEYCRSFNRGVMSRFEKGKGTNITTEDLFHIRSLVSMWW